MAINVNRFEQMFEYLCIPEWNEENTLKWLNAIMDNNLYNQKSTDTIDYERLIYTELYFKDNDQIQTMVSLIKNTLYETYIRKKRVLYASKGI